MAREIKKLVIHQSASTWGDVTAITRWHRARGFRTCGYHFVITNGRRTAKSKYSRKFDGVVQRGRPVEEVGAHVAHANQDSIGICVIGKGSAYLTMPQVASLLDVLRKLIKRHELEVDAVTVHNEYPSAQAQGKTCPGFEGDKLRAILARFQ